LGRNINPKRKQVKEKSQSVDLNNLTTDKRKKLAAKKSYNLLEWGQKMNPKSPESANFKK
jgi:hypothetical protein